MKKNNVLVKLGDGIRLERLRQKLSQQELAEKAGIAQYQQVGRIERAEINTSVVTLFAILKALDCNLEKIIDIKS